MKIDDKISRQILDILTEEIIPAEGCTEPIAIAYTAAKAVETLGCEPDKIDVYVSGNMIKNVKSVIVPNSQGMVGIEASAALGAFAGNSSRELLVISDINSTNLTKAKEFIESNKINVIHEESDIKLYVKIIVSKNDQSASVEIKHIHTNITEIIKNGKITVSRPCNDSDFNSSLSDRKILSVELIYTLAKTIDIELIKPLFEKVIKLNCAIASEGLKEVYGANIGAMIQENIDKGIYGDDLRNRAASLAAAGSDARMSGCPLPVMTTSGSGNQGMTASLPIIKYCNDKHISEENMIRALFLSHTLTIHIKTNVGRLSAYCGAVCAAAGVSGALTFLEGGDLKAVGDAVTNTLANISGLICDGAKASCAFKIATGIYTAFDSAMLALNRKVFNPADGIVSKNIEETIKNIGRLSQEGMAGTDKTILEIMSKN